MVEIQTQRPVALELYKDYKELGRFMLRYVGSTIAAGVVTEVKHSTCPPFLTTHSCCKKHTSCIHQHFLISHHKNVTLVNADVYTVLDQRVRTSWNWKSEEECNFPSERTHTN